MDEGEWVLEVASSGGTDFPPLGFDNKKDAVRFAKGMREAGAIVKVRKFKGHARPEAGEEK